MTHRLFLVFDANSKYDFQAIIVDKGSSDRTWELLQQIHYHNNRFGIIQLSTNFKMDGGITVGLHYASGNAAALMKKLATSIIAGVAA